jgi:hypothetical protein
VITGEGIYPPSNPFNYKTFPGTNFLPTVYTNMFDGTGLEMPNTLPSTPDNPYNLHDGDPAVSQINPTSPEDDLRAIINLIADRGAEETVGRDGKTYRQQAVQAAIRLGLDILEGQPVANRAYSGLPLLHYTGPEKVKTVQVIKDETGKVVGGNVDVHQVWFGQRIEADTAFLDVSQVADVPWTITYTVDVLNRGRDDFSPFVMYLDNPSLAKPGMMAPPHVGMDQSFFNMDDGTRTVFKIKMTLGQYYNLVYTWGWRMHPPRAQVMENAHKAINYGGTTPPACPAEYQGLTLPQLEQAVFCQPGDPGCTSTRCKPGEARFGPDGQPTACEKAALYAIAQIGELAPEKRMWRALLDARKAADRGDLEGAAEIARTRALPAYFDWLDRDSLPAGVEPDRARTSRSFTSTTRSTAGSRTGRGAAGTSGKSARRRSRSPPSTATTSCTRTPSRTSAATAAGKTSSNRRSSSPDRAAGSRSAAPTGRCPRAARPARTSACRRRRTGAPASIASRSSSTSTRPGGCVSINSIRCITTWRSSRSTEGL